LLISAKRTPLLDIADRKPHTPNTSFALLAAGTVFAVGVSAIEASAEEATFEDDYRESRENEASRSKLYPSLEPYRSGRLQVSPIHNIYFEECGNPQGKPVVVLHGGPGGGCSPTLRRFFDPSVYRIVLFDQRGSGKSTPCACVEENTTWLLVDDMEILRKHLGIDKWMLFGGSWGSTLALAYAEMYPANVTEMVLRGIFLLRKSELNFFYQEGASHIFPDAWEMFEKFIPPQERSDMMNAYRRLLTSDDPAKRKPACKEWTAWELRTSCLRVSADLVGDVENDAFAEAVARIEHHFFVNRGFFPNESYLLDNVYKIRHIPCVMVQGRYDMVCPMKSAWELHKAWPEAKLVVIPDAGHSALEQGIISELVRATDCFRN